MIIGRQEIAGCHRAVSTSDSADCRFSPDFLGLTRSRSLVFSYSLFSLSTVRFRVHYYVNTSRTEAEPQSIMRCRGSLISPLKTPRRRGFSRKRHNVSFLLWSEDSQHRRACVLPGNFQVHEVYRSGYHWRNQARLACSTRPVSCSSLHCRSNDRAKH